MSIDPEWAWSPYEPSADHPWNRQQAAHLYRRAGFGATTDQLDSALGKSPLAAVAELLDPGDTSEFDREMDTFGKTVRGDPNQLSAWWLYRMINTPDPLLEMTTLFWHGHFATSAAKVTDAKLMLRQNRLLREQAQGNFTKMVQAISRDPAMLIYLDSTTNRKLHPNENYARELLELFCLGLGNYTEKDIQEIARCFTGWEVNVRRGEFRFNKYQQDKGEKSFLGQTGKFTGEDAVRIVVAQRAAPQFIVRKLIRYFVFDEPEPPLSLVEPLAKELRERDFDIAWLLRRILTSNLFFSDDAIGRKIRSPIELGVGLLRALEGRTNVTRLSASLAALGQSPFFPPNVKGWDGGRTWINSSTLLGRVNLVRQILTAEESKFDGGDLITLAKKHNAAAPESLVQWLLEMFVAVPVPDDVHQSLVDVARTSEGNTRVIKVIQTISTLPEFQLC